MAVGKKPPCFFFKKNYYICTPFAEIAQLVEHQLPKLRVAGSIPVFRSDS